MLKRAVIASEDAGRYLSEHEVYLRKTDLEPEARPSKEETGVYKASLFRFHVRFPECRMKACFVDLAP